MVVVFTFMVIVSKIDLMVVCIIFETISIKLWVYKVTLRLARPILCLNYAYI